MIEPFQPPSQRMSWTVSALLLAAGDTLAARFGAVSVRGEISGYSRAASGHCYFSLKDGDGAGALLRCAMFRRAASLLDFAPADGQQVEVRGRLAIYEGRGELQLVVEALQRLGAGTLYEEFLRRRARLEAAGLFDPAGKRELPVFPAAVGVITSLGAAALHDVLTALARRAPHVRVVIYPSLVQGADAPAALMQALHTANERNEVDTLLLVRGGGSLEDLWGFNDERLVRAVAASPIPVVCGVGHETDVTLCELAADLRAATPTAAAELAAPVQAEQLRGLGARQTLLQRHAERLMQGRAQHLDHLALRLGQPGRALLVQGGRLDEAQRRLQRVVQIRTQRAAEDLPRAATRLQRAAATQLGTLLLRVDAAQQRLQAQDPHRVLRRGYAWVEAADGRPVVSTQALQPGQQVTAVWSDGRADVQVERVLPLSPAG